MKKFSKITNQKVGQEPKIEVKINEEDIFKMRVMNLLDQLLVIRTYGPVDNHQRAGTIKISGKDLFVEALMNLFDSKSLKDQGKLLENLKSKVRDWEMIDVEISDINKQILESRNKNELISYKRNLISLYNKYKDDDDILIKMVESSCSKIKSSQRAHKKALTADLIMNEGIYPKDIFSKISEKFNEKAKELGYTK